MTAKVSLNICKSELVELINFNLAAYLQSEHLKLNIKNHNSAGQYKCEADNGIDEKQSKIITINVNGMSNFNLNFALCKVNLFLNQNVELKSVSVFSDKNIASPLLSI